MRRERTCSVDGCERDQWARGWCTGHYQRWRRTGDPKATERTFPPLDDAFGNWFSGFFAGEGSLMITAAANSDGFARHRCVATITLRADDRPVLEEIAQRLDCGKLLDLKARDNTCPSTRWLADNKAECQRLVEVFDAYPLRAKKANDYVVWRKAVTYWCDLPRGKRYAGHHLGLAEMTRLKREIQDVRRFPHVA